MTGQPPAPRSVLAISSQVARGSVGLRAAGFAMERLGVPVWKVPTIWLPWHPGHSGKYGVPLRSVPADHAFEMSLQALVAAPFVGELGAILTGYFATAGQVEAAGQAIDVARSAVPDLTVIVDPVSADEGGSYVHEAVLAAIRDHLVPRADILTPNRFELALLTGRSLDDNAALIKAVETLFPARTVVTSAHGMMRGATGSLIVEPGKALLIEHQRVDGAPNGTGDLLSALIAAHILRGLPLETAVEKATASTFEMIARTVRAGSNELILAREQDSLVSPMAMVARRLLGLPKTPRVKGSP